MLGFIAACVLVPLAAAQQLCNGYAEYCDRRYSNISFLGTHDSAFIRTTAESSLFGNQFYNVSVQLESGIRFLQAQVHSGANETIELCHSTCNLPGSDFGPLQTYLAQVASFLAANENEVVTILFVNSGFSPIQWADAYAQVGLDQFVYAPASSLEGVLSLADWPTLGTMIADNTRIVTFLDTGANVSSVPWLLDEFSNIWETPYDLLSTAFTCTYDRPYNTSAQASIPANEKMYLVNHFLDYEIGTTGIDVPNVTFADVTNSQLDTPGSLAVQYETCFARHARVPNIVLVDFFDQGGESDLAQVAQVNGVRYRSSLAFPGAFPVPGSQNVTYNATFAPVSASAQSIGASASASTSATALSGSTSAIASVRTSTTIGTTRPAAIVGPAQFTRLSSTVANPASTGTSTSTTQAAGTALISAGSTTLPSNHATGLCTSRIWIILAACICGIYCI